MAGYTMLTPTLRMRQGQAIGSIDALIFDIDGVVMDVSYSFSRVICETVQHYFQHILHFSGETKLVEPTDIKGFKLAGGFNNDWRITQVLILFYLEKSWRENSTDLATLGHQGMGIAQLTTELRSLGGGLAAMEKIQQHCPPQAREYIKRRYDQNHIIRIFQEIYGGKQCRKLYGFTPREYLGVGLMELERPIIRKDLISLPYGIITGRLGTEARMALNQSGLTLPKDWLITPDKGLEKPDPRCLRKLVTEMGFQRAIFVGDTVDDWFTVDNYARYQKAPTVLFCAVESGELGAISRPTFQELGVDLIAEDVNQLLNYLNTYRG